LDQTWLSRAALILDRFVQVKGIASTFKFAGADTSQHQQPDVQGQLISIEGCLVIDVSIMELKSGAIARNFWWQILDCGEKNAQPPWDRKKGIWDTVDKILLKVSAPYINLHYLV